MKHVHIFIMHTFFLISSLFIWSLICVEAMSKNLRISV